MGFLPRIKAPQMDRPSPQRPSQVLLRLQDLDDLCNDWPPPEMIRNVYARYVMQNEKYRYTHDRLSNTHIYKISTK